MFILLDGWRILKKFSIPLFASVHTSTWSASSHVHVAAHSGEASDFIKLSGLVLHAPGIFRAQQIFVRVTDDKRDGFVPHDLYGTASLLFNHS